MKHLFFWLFVIFFFTACKKAGDTSNSSPNSNFQNNMGTGCKACEYAPLCDGSYFSYKDTSYQLPVTYYTDTLRSLGDTLLNGVTYKMTRRISPRYSQIEYTNCDNGVYSFISRSLSSPTPIGKPLIYLKANAPVGSSWIETVDNNKLTYTIEGKGLTIRVNNKDYSDVIKVKQIFEAPNSVATIYWYYSKGIGQINYHFASYNSDPSFYHYFQLQSYFIP